MSLYVTHENTELPPLSRGRQERSATRATQFPRDLSTTLSERSEILVVTTGGGSDPDRNPAPSRPSVRPSLADTFVTQLFVIRVD